MALLIFDVDGTLVDSAELTVAAVTDVFGRFPGLDCPSRETIVDTFGLSERDMWRRLMPAGTEEERRRGSSLYDETIVRYLERSDVLLPHVVEVLRELKASGHRLTTASNCDAPYLNAVLDSQRIRGFFEHPLCLGMVGGGVKADILAVHFERFGKADAWMIGDRSSDMEAARAHGIPAIGCAFGFGGPGELDGAARRITSLLQLLEMDWS